MKVTTNKTVQPAQGAANDKAELLMELADRYNYWMAKNRPEYAEIYERMMYAHTMPPPAQSQENTTTKSK